MNITQILKQMKTGITFGELDELLGYSGQNYMESIRNKYFKMEDQATIIKLIGDKIPQYRTIEALGISEEEFEQIKEVFF